MSFDELDTKSRDAADMHQPSYKEHAWSNMEDLLDQHLPQKKNNYKRYFFWFLAFLVSTSLMMIWLNRDPVSTQTSIPVEKIQESEIPISPNQPGVIEDDKMGVGNEKTNSFELQPGSLSDVEGFQKTIKKMDLKNPFTNKSSSSSTDQSGNFVNPDFITGNNKDFTLDEWRPSSNTLLSGKASLLINDDYGSLTDQFNNKQDVPVTYPLPELEKSTAGRKSFLQKISFTASAGPSVSSVSINNPGRVTTMYGAGIKYKINNKWSLGTGFLINKKIYAAGKEDYRPPASFWNYYTNLLNVDADCDVLEIPLTVSYSINKTRKHEWIASTGISNYIMKKETYDYSYKDNAGQIQNREWSVANNNLHNFSALTLSAGYKHHINNRVSILIEPNVKIPLKGVGYGKVKFYNAATLITLQVNPFVKK